MNQTVVFAENELKKYWNLLTGGKDCEIILENENLSSKNFFSESYSVDVNKG